MSAKELSVREVQFSMKKRILCFMHESQGLYLLTLLRDCYRSIQKVEYALEHADLSATPLFYVLQFTTTEEDQEEFQDLNLI